MEGFPEISKAKISRNVRTVYQHPTVGSWFENIAVRPSGDILVTRIDAPELWTVNPNTGAASVLVNFTGTNLHSVMGIAELSADVWALGVGHYDHQNVPASDGSWEIWLVDLTASSGNGTPQTKLLAKIPEAGMINGLTTWSTTSVLAVDSMHGVIFKIDTETGAYSAVIKDAGSMAPPAGAPIPIGINGVKVRDGFVYYTNTTMTCLFRMPVDENCHPTGAAEAITTGIIPDDFCFDDGASGDILVAYVTGNVSNVVSKVLLPREGAATVETFAGDFERLDMAGATACAFGRGEDDRRTLYIVTAGGSALPVNGSLMEAAKLAAIEVN